MIFRYGVLHAFCHPQLQELEAGIPSPQWPALVMAWRTRPWLAAKDRKMGLAWYPWKGEDALVEAAREQGLLIDEF